MRQQRGFTLIELMVVLLIVVVTWVALAPSLQTDQQRTGRQWLEQAEAMLLLSCDLSAQSLQPHRLVWQETGLLMQRWQQQNWVMVADVPELKSLEGWQIQLIVDGVKKNIKQKQSTAWMCMADGSQTAGSIQLTREGLGQLQLQWQGDGRYAQSAGF
jgi:prepilin-type N-terminal cleavage/methylation domain-containing protein